MLKEGRQERRKEGRKEGRKALGRLAGGQSGRQTDIQMDGWADRQRMYPLFRNLVWRAPLYDCFWGFCGICYTPTLPTMVQGSIMFRTSKLQCPWEVTEGTLSRSPFSPAKVLSMWIFLSLSYFVLIISKAIIAVVVS